MTEKLPISAKNHSIDNSASRSGSLLGRGLAGIKNKKPAAIDVSPLMIRAMNSILRLAVLDNKSTKFEDIAKSLLEELRANIIARNVCTIKEVDDLIASISVDELKDAYVGAFNQQTEELQGTSSLEEIAAFKSIADLYDDSEKLTARYRKARRIYDEVFNYGYKLVSCQKLTDIFTEFEELAKQGYGKAYFPLACIYSDSQCEYHDIEKSNHFYKSAFGWCFDNQIANDTEIWRDLAVMYYHGTGVERDIQQAIFWYRVAAENGHADAQYWHGFLIKN